MLYWINRLISQRALVHRAFWVFLCHLPCVQAQLSVVLTPSIASPASVGQLVTWNASASGAGPAELWYRFRVRRVGGDFRTVIDYGPNNSFEWTATDHEGVYEVEASVRALQGGGTAAAKARFEMRSNVTGRLPVVRATSHPLVFLYSAPPCPKESRMRVRFQSPGEQAYFTAWKNCTGDSSMNFYLAGMYPQTDYTAAYIVDTGAAFLESPAVRFTTGKETILPAAQKILAPHDGDGMILQSNISANIAATDLDGKLMWYYAKPVMLMTRPGRDGTFWATTGGPLFGLPPNDLEHETVREFDLIGMTVTETNVARVNEQLAAMGKPRITGFHHEAMRLPDGRVLVLASEERILSDVQGPGPVDVIGDAIIVMDRNLQVIWTWDAFAHLDVKRKATLNETCSGCAALAKAANDWTHTNSVEQTPDGNLLISVRNQDFIYKIAYENGEGDGHVLWKLGKGGDFQLNVSDPTAWFSHQHDARYASGDEITLYDDGNVRQAADPKAHSRGQSIRIDEERMTAELILNADLGVFSSALGSAQKLPGGDYVFLSGFLAGNTSQTTEVDGDGRIVYRLTTGSQQYRSFRMRDLYSAPN